MEYQALDLASRGNVQEAGSLFNSERYAHLLQLYSSGLQAIEARSEAYVQAMESKVAWYLKVILGLSFVACGLIALGWAALVRPARRWGDQLNEAREEADRARRQVEEQQAGLEDLNRKFFDQARVDPLTKLGTRLKFNEDVETLWQRIVRYGERYGAIMCDIDNFKQYNDTYGHIAGDQILRQVADALSAVCRGGDEIYRFGGEEFLVILPNATLAGSAASAERYRAAVERLSIPHSGSAAGIVTISMGVACSDACDATTIDAWLHEADIALYEAKRTGRNRVETRPLVPETSGPSL
jgi:diguanylate cyclase (GGDEF)-like protein